MGSAALLAAAFFSIAAAPVPPEGGVALDASTVLIAGGVDPDHQPDGNSVVMRGPTGVVVVDTGRHPAQLARIEAAIAATGQPLSVIVNSHWHLDHVSGNPALRGAHPGVSVWASDAIDGALAGFLKASAEQGQSALDKGDLPESMAADVRADMATIAAGERLRPDHVVRKSARVRLAGRSFDLHFAANAVTAGDIWLYDRAQARAIVGDLVTLPAPFLDTACPQGWAAALKAIDDSGFVTLVPGHGPVMDHPAFAAWRAAFTQFVDCSADAAQPVKTCVAGWMAYARGVVGAAQQPLAGGLAGYYAGLVRSGALRRNCPA
ncbi:MBL fold metallo-hydrolase [Sphingomonas sp. 28-63-12]|uniref:MBL fold metallo-hydrolase n=1 Tax=Sphingomonas sp. 28-63-12 TaxID=1970434 RepID=UPI000BD5E4F1|nr:MAG: hypothetical protein B7Y47_11760 [Sphingomonas sp. 28-63-12]